MWVLKTHGESYYVNHVTCEIPWTTKETPDNTHTKGSIKVKDCLLKIDSDTNEATISKLTIYDKIRLRNQKLGISRIMFSSYTFERTLKEEAIRHSPFKRVQGACGTAYTVCDILDQHDTMLLGLKCPGQFRVLMPNETYYQAYDDRDLWKKLQQNYDQEEYGETDPEDFD